MRGQGYLNQPIRGQFSNCIGTRRRLLFNDSHPTINNLKRFKFESPCPPPLMRGRRCCQGHWYQHFSEMFLNGSQFVERTMMGWWFILKTPSHQTEPIIGHRGDWGLLSPDIRPGELSEESGTSWENCWYRVLFRLRPRRHKLTEGGFILCSGVPASIITYQGSEQSDLFMYNSRQENIFNCKKLKNFSFNDNKINIKKCEWILV